MFTHLDFDVQCEYSPLTGGHPADHLVHNHVQAKHAKGHRVYNTHHLAIGNGEPDGLVVHPPVDPDEYRVTPGEMVALINCSEAKGVNTAIALAKANPDVGFLFVEGAYGEQVKPELANCEWMEQVADARDIYAKTRVLLIPSLYESYGRVGREAAASGIPVICSDTPGLRESMGEYAMCAGDYDDIGAWRYALDTVLCGRFAPGELPLVDTTAEIRPP